MDQPTEVVIDYTNHRGERKLRRITPIAGSIRFAESPEHKPAQWIFDALCWDRAGARRTFALADIHEWQARR